MKPFVLPVLLFHSVSPMTPEYISVTPSFFERVIRFVSSNYHPVGIEYAYRQVKKNVSPHKKSVIVCFDDGYQDVFTYALPILQKYHIPAVFFLLPTYLGKSNLWNPKAEYIRPHLTKEQLLELMKQGFQIGSHGLSHHKLKKFNEATIRVELSKSREILEKITKKSVPWFAFPYGSYNTEIVHTTSDYYDLSFATEMGCSNWRQLNLGAIKRINIYSTYTWAKIKKIIESSFV